MRNPVSLLSSESCCSTGCAMAFLVLFLDAEEEAIV